MANRRHFPNVNAPDEDRVEVALALLQRMLVSEAKAELRRRYGVCSTTAMVYVQQARAYMRGAANINRQEEIGKTLCQLEQIIHDRQAKNSDRVAAIKVKARLLGLEAPVRIETTSPPMFDLDEVRGGLKVAQDVPTVNIGQADTEALPAPAAPPELRNGTHPPIDVSDR